MESELKKFQVSWISKSQVTPRSTSRQGRLSLYTDGDKCAMVNFSFRGMWGWGEWAKSYLSMYLLYIVFLPFSQKNFLARYARSIAFYPQLTNASMQWVLPTPFIYIFHFLVIIPDCQLPKFTENAHKLHKIAYKMSKQFLLGWEWRKSVCGET